MLSAILFTLLAMVVAVAVTLFAANVIARYIRVPLKREYMIAFGVLAAIFGLLFALSQPLALFAWVIFANLAIILFILTAIRRYLEDHPKDGAANHRHKDGQ